MSNQLAAIIPQKKNGKEKFIFKHNHLPFKLLDFWRWFGSNLISNAMRGILAEYIVAESLKLKIDVRSEWDAYDLDYNGLKIEVKSSAYLQSWPQNEFSKIVFGIQPALAWDYNTNTFNDEIKRNSDVYIFCVLKHKNPDTIDPMNLDQWEFYILSTKILDEKIPRQKTITLSSLLLHFNLISVKYNQIETEINRLKLGMFEENR